MVVGSNPVFEMSLLTLNCMHTTLISLDYLAICIIYGIQYLLLKANSLDPDHIAYILNGSGSQWITMESRVNGPSK
jgi:hypothetical protein